MLHQFGRWEFTPSQSPFCFKLETFFRIARIPYINEYGIKMSNKGKLPFIEVDGKQYCDSHLIIQMFKQKYHIDLDSHLTIQQHAILYSFQRLLEDHLNFGVLHLRWTDNFPEVRKYSLKLPFLIDLLFAPMIQSQMIKQSVAQGIGKHSNDEIIALIHEDLEALSILLGDKTFMFGELPSTLDIIAFPFLANFLYVPFPGPLFDILSKYPNLVNFTHRFKNLFWSDWDEVLQK